jgi:FKBP-type peptidyl-prolyl cis-trans isomerase
MLPRRDRTKNDVFERSSAAHERKGESMNNSKPEFRILALAAFCVFTAAACSNGGGTAEQSAGTDSEAASEEVAAEEAAAEEVITTETGLQYVVIEEGTGATPGFTDSVTVHYRGTLLDGTEFDSSHKRGEPAVFPVNRVIKGWTEALMLMKEGAKYKLTIPPDLAYGERGAGALIGPNETLQFEVELIKVN